MRPKLFSRQAAETTVREEGGGGGGGGGGGRGEVRTVVAMRKSVESKTITSY